MLARSGIGNITVIDADNVAVSNINRQLIADFNTVGLSKVRLFADRFKAINPDINVTAIQDYITPDNIGELLSPGFDYVVDAIDTVAPKVALIEHCLRHKIPVISSMGAGGRTDPTKVEYMDINATRDDGLARVVRQRLRKDGFRHGLKVVASREVPHRNAITPLEELNKKSSFGTLATIPAIFGIMLAAQVIDKLSQHDSTKA